MTKKHFDALAAEIRCQQPQVPVNPDGSYDHDTTIRYRQWVLGAAMVADVCARFNPNFDRARFLKACGVEG